ncbi:MAG: putative membrane protein [Planctomycetota bacterium]|jgi:uncharacterized membrane protein
MSFSALQEQVAAAQDISVRETWRFLEMPELWVVVLILVPLAALISWATYARESVSNGARTGLSLLRFASLLVLLFVLFRPVLVQHSEEVRQAQVLVLFDDSASMQRQDAYLGAGEAREALNGLSATSLENTTRSELAARALDTQLLPHLAGNQYEARLLRFAEEVAPLSSTEALTARGRGTYLGDAIRQSMAQSRGKHLTDIVILSDGRSNGGSSPLDAARSAGAAGIPIHTVVVGDTRRERNVFVELAEVPEDVLEGDEIAITVRVAGRGLEPGTETIVVLEELNERGEDARLITEESVAPNDTGERVSFLAPAEAPNQGQRVRRFRVTVNPIPEETLLNDNSVEFSVGVMPEEIRVLYIDGYPRWEYRFLKELLKRADQNISLQVFLLSATPDFIQEHSPGLPSLLEVPTDRRELLDNYDVIILGDFNPNAISPDPARCEEFQESLLEFVMRGGGVLFSAGEFENPRSYLDTKLEELMPIVLDSTSGLPYQGDTTVAFHPTLESPAQPHQVVRLSADGEQNRVLWEDSNGLSGHYWYSVVQRAKPGSQVLLRHPTNGGPYGRHPLLAVGYYPAGRTMFLGIDSTWMWRYRFGDRYHGRFWRNAIRWLALGRLKSGDRRYHLDSLRSSYSLDERVTLEARVLNEDFRPSDRSIQELKLRDPDGNERDISAALVAGREGIYRSSFDLNQPGVWRAWIQVGGEAIATTEFDVLLPSRESADPSPDPEGLAAMSQISAGRSLSLAEFALLLDEFPGGEERREPISSRLEDAWDNWVTLLAILGLLTSEWILRKRYQLV